VKKKPEKELCGPYERGKTPLEEGHHKIRKEMNFTKLGSQNYLENGFRSEKEVGENGGEKIRRGFPWGTDKNLISRGVRPVT